jgi:copper(I)-binding protein
VAVIRSTSRSVLAGLVAVAGLALAGCGAGQIAQTALQSPTVDGANVQVGEIAVRNVALEYPAQGSYPKGSDARLRMIVVNQGTSSDTLTEVRSPAATDVTITAAANPSAGPTPTLTAPPPSDQPTGTASGTPTGTNEPASPSASAGSGEPSGGASGSATPSGSASGSASASASAAPVETEAPAARITIPANGLVSFTGDGPTVELTGLTRELYPSQPLSVTLVFQKAGEVTFTIAVSAPEGQISLAPTVTTATEGSEG